MNKFLPKASHTKKLAEVSRSNILFFQFILENFTGQKVVDERHPFCQRLHTPKSWQKYPEVTSFFSNLFWKASQARKLSMNNILFAKLHRPERTQDKTPQKHYRTLVTKQASPFTFSSSWVLIEVTPNP